MTFRSDNPDKFASFRFTLRGDKQWAVELGATSWRVGLNPVADGLALFVDRGIACDNHTELLTTHCTNTPELEDVVAAVKKFGSEWDRAITGFCSFMHEASRLKEREGISLLFKRELLEDIKRESVRIYDERAFLKVHSPTERRQS